MKRVVLDGMIVENVEAVDDDAEGFLVPNETYVGPGCIWNGDGANPVFTPPDQEADHGDFSVVSV